MVPKAVCSACTVNLKLDTVHTTQLYYLLLGAVRVSTDAGFSSIREKYCRYLCQIQIKEYFTKVSRNFQVYPFLMQMCVQMQKSTSKVENGFHQKGFSRFKMSLFYTDSENYFTLVIKCTKKE